MFTIAFNNFFVVVVADTHLRILSSFVFQQASFKQKQFTDIAGSEKKESKRQISGMSANIKKSMNSRTVYQVNVLRIGTSFVCNSTIRCRKEVHNRQ